LRWPYGFLQKQMVSVFGPSEPQKLVSNRRAKNVTL
jgi:hypothetical protein